MSDDTNNGVPENNYPWVRQPRTLSFLEESHFEEFLSRATAAMRRVSLTHHFESLSSLIDLHRRFCSFSGGSLEDAWKSISVEECGAMKELTCVGLARALKDYILEDKPEWEDYIGLTLTNEWTSEEPVAETFWTNNDQPSFPLQCREHSLLFVKVLLPQKRDAVVLLDPGRCLATPLVVTEDGQPPQSPTIVLKRFHKTREHTATWGGQDYLRWTIGTRKKDSYSVTHLRVYVGGSYEAGSYLDWHNLMFPYRAIMFMSPCNLLSTCLRVEVGKTVDYVVVLVTDDETGDINEFKVPFESEAGLQDKGQRLAMKVLAKRVGPEKLNVLMEGLEKVLKDEDFASEFLNIWKKVKLETENSFRSHVLNR